MSIERLHSIHRSPVSLFDSSWDVGSWDDFEATLRAMERRMREMDRQFEQMFNQFLRLNPTSETRTSFRGRSDRSDRLGFSSGFGSGFGSSGFDELEPPSFAGAIEGASGSSGSGTVVPRRPGMLRRQPSWDWGFPDTDHPNPITTDKEGKRIFRLQYDVRQFKPEDITVKTLDNKLEVSAKHEEGDDSNKMYREYHRMCMLPEGLEPESLSSSFSPEGVLSIEAPLPAIEPPKPKTPALTDKPVPIAIQHQKSVSGDEK